jgi:biopolymer transport protein TolR
MRRSARHVRRALRAARARKFQVALNIVSLIDIFAILVFYLLVNALVVEVLPSAKALTLPESVVDEVPRQTTVVMVTAEAVLMDSKPVMTLDEAKAAPENRSLAPLLEHLQSKPRHTREGALGSDETMGEVNVMADKGTPYAVLKKVLKTCTEARADKIALAVMEKQVPIGGQP